MVTTLLAGMLIASAKFATYLPLLSQQRQAVQSRTNNQGALLSAVGYAKYAVQRQWCVATDWQQDFASCATPDQTFQFARSLPRLILRPTASKNLSLFLPGNPDPKNIPLGFVEGRILKDEVTPLHPLYAPIKQLRDDSLGVYLRVRRINNAFLPSTSSEIHLEFYACSITDRSATGTAACGSKPIMLQEVVSLYSRSVDSFALITNRDLNLGNNLSSKNALRFPKITYTAPNELSSFPGITFRSPIFTNGSVHIEPASGGTGQKDFWPVTFASRVTLGEGSLYSNGNLFQPDVSPDLGLDSLRTTAVQGALYGILDGVSLQSRADKGLTCLFDRSVCANSSSDINEAAARMAACVKKRELAGSLNKTDDSRLVVRSTQTNGIDLFEYDLGLTLKNEFRGSDWRAPKPNALSGLGVSFSGMPAVKPDEKIPAALELSITVGDRQATVLAPRTGEVTIEVPPLTLPEQTRLSNLPNDISNAETRLIQLQNDLNQLQMNAGNGNGNGNDPKIIAKQQEITDQTNFINALRSDNARLTNLSQNPVKLKIQSSAPNSGRTTHRLNFQITGIKDSLGHLASNGRPISVKTTACDYGTKRETCEQFRPSASAAGYINTNLDNAGPGPNAKDNIFTFTYDPMKQRFAPSVEGSRQNSEGWAHFASSGAVGPPTDSPDLSQDFEGTDCDSKQAQALMSAFGNSNLSDDYSASSQVSWGFTQRYAPGSEWVIQDKLTAPEWEVVSMVDTCIIGKDKTLVAGFYTCKNLVIKRNRTQRLQIIGTFIIDQLTFEDADNAYRNGIDWMSIHHSAALPRLRDLMRPTVFKKMGTTFVPDPNFANATCNDPRLKMPNDPSWNPTVGLQTWSNSVRCSIASLRGQADPFTWPEITPLCGLSPGSSATSCKLRDHPTFHQFVTVSVRSTL
ncbi:MAG: hypothetical protein KGQ59_07200 [Bdellovibrionales bacterium]|nr:hypothetical protein [Bdellovibrionales bacterium]